MYCFVYKMIQFAIFVSLLNFFFTKQNNVIMKSNSLSSVSKYVHSTLIDYAYNLQIHVCIVSDSSLLNLQQSSVIAFIFSNNNKQEEFYVIFWAVVQWYVEKFFFS